MRCRKFFNHKLLLSCCNLVFLACGITLLVSAFCLLSDNSRILLSRLLGPANFKLTELPQPLFYYIALALVGTGILTTLASIFGLWAACTNTIWFLCFNFLFVLALLIIEFGICLLITIWPQCLGLNFDTTMMVRALQGNYGIPGHEQFTSAMDLAQTQLECCAMNSDINYDTSLWRLQGFGNREWTVPLTCCHLSNHHEKGAYLNPKPANLTQCQALQKHVYETARHTDGCLNKIDLWYQEQYVLFLGASLIVAIVEFCVLLSIVLSCTRLSRRRRPSEVLDPVDSVDTMTTVSNKDLTKKCETTKDSNTKDDLSESEEPTREQTPNVLHPNNASSNNSSVIKRHKVVNRSVSPAEPSDIDEETYIETLRMLNERQKTIYQSQRSSSKPDLQAAGVKETFTQTHEFFQNNNKNQNNTKRLKNLHQNVATIQAEIKDMQTSTSADTAYQNNPLRTSKIHNKRQKNYFQLQSLQSLPMDHQPEVKKTFTQPSDLFQAKHETPFRNFRSSRISRSYLV